MILRTIKKRAQSNKESLNKENLSRDEEQDLSRLYFYIRGTKTLKIYGYHRQFDFKYCIKLQSFIFLHEMSQQLLGKSYS